VIRTIRANRLCSSTRVACAAGLALGLASGAAATTYSVSPTRVVLTTAMRSQLVTIKNESDRPLRFQLSMMAWSQDPAGAMQLAPTEDVVYFPSLLTLEKGEERKVRVGTAVPAGSVERSYRLFIEELPPAERPDQSGVVRILTRTSIPSSFSPPSPLRSPFWRAWPSLEAGSPSFCAIPGQPTSAARRQGDSFRCAGPGGLRAGCQRLVRLCTQVRAPSISTCRRNAAGRSGHWRSPLRSKARRSADDSHAGRCLRVEVGQDRHVREPGDPLGACWPEAGQASLRMVGLARLSLIALLVPNLVVQRKSPRGSVPCCRSW